MAISADQQMLADYLAAWAARDSDRIVSYFTDDGEYEDVTLGQVYRGKPAVREFVAGTFAAFPDFSIEIKSEFMSPAGGGTEWIMSGTHAGDLPGLPRTGKKFAVRGASVVELREGKIRRNADYWDMAAFLRQLGLMPNPGA